MEFVIENKTESTITTNFSQLKASLEIQLKKFENYEVTETALQEGKTLRATLNKVSKMIDDRRKELKNELLKPYEKIEQEAKTLTSMISEVITNIDKQIKDFEEKERADKQALIDKLWELVKGDLPNEITFFNQRWLNKTFAMSDVKKEMEEKVIAIKNDIKTINDLATEHGEEYLPLWLAKYYVNLDLTPIKNEIELLKRVVYIEVDAPTPTPVVEPTVTIEPPTIYQYTLSFLSTKEQAQLLYKFLNKNNITYKKVI